MKTFFTLVLLAGFFFCIYWFMSFQRDPYMLCQDHPNKKLRSKYYLCWPGDFEFPKGVLEKTLNTPFLNQNHEDKLRDRDSQSKGEDQPKSSDPFDNSNLREPPLDGTSN